MPCAIPLAHVTLKYGTTVWEAKATPVTPLSYTATIANQRDSRLNPLATFAQLSSFPQRGCPLRSIYLGWASRPTAGSGAPELGSAAAKLPCGAWIALSNADLPRWYRAPKHAALRPSPGYYAPSTTHPLPKPRFPSITWCTASPPTRRGPPYPRAPICTTAPHPHNKALPLPTRPPLLWTPPPPPPHAQSPTLGHLRPPTHPPPAPSRSAGPTTSAQTRPGPCKARLTPRHPTHCALSPHPNSSHVPTTPAPS